MKKYNVAILGATGAVGGEFLKLIEERNFPFAELRLLASKRSAGTEKPEPLRRGAHQHGCCLRCGSCVQ